MQDDNKLTVSQKNALERAITLLQAHFSAAVIVVETDTTKNSFSSVTWYGGNAAGLGLARLAEDSINEQVYENNAGPFEEDEDDNEGESWKEK